MPFHVDELFKQLLKSKVKKIDKPWGTEHIINCPGFLLKVIKVDVGHRTSLQYHEKKNEIIIPLEGMGYLEHGDTRGSSPDAFLGEIKVFRIKPGIQHRAHGPLLMFELTTKDNEDVVRVADDYGRIE